MTLKIKDSNHQVNNAGTNHRQLDFVDLASDLWEPLVDLNIKAGLYMIKYIALTYLYDNSQFK